MNHGPGSGLTEDEMDAERRRPPRRAMTGLEEKGPPGPPVIWPTSEPAPAAATAPPGAIRPPMRSPVNPLLLHARLALLRPRPMPLVKKPDPQP